MSARVFFPLHNKKVFMDLHSGRVVKSIYYFLGGIVPKVDKLQLIKFIFKFDMEPNMDD
jgi:hypothetical protein